MRLPRSLMGAAAATLVLALASCASVRVQLFTAGLTDAEVGKVSSALEAHGYKVHLNDLPVPEAVKFPTLVYYPVRDDHSRIRQLSSLLAQLGYNLDMTPVSAGNHFYTSGNVGIYLVPYRPVRQAVTLSGKSFTGVCPNFDADLTLNADSTFTLQIERWNKERQREDVITTRKGKWRKSDQVVMLEFAGQDVAYDLSHTRRNTRYGVRNTWQLHRRGPADVANPCDFNYTELEMGD